MDRNDSLGQILKIGCSMVPGGTHGVCLIETPWTLGEVGARGTKCEGLRLGKNLGFSKPTTPNIIGNSSCPSLLYYHNHPLLHHQNTVPGTVDWSLSFSASVPRLLARFLAASEPEGDNGNQVPRICDTYQTQMIPILCQYEVKMIAPSFYPSKRTKVSIHFVGPTLWQPWFTSVAVWSEGEWVFSLILFIQLIPRNRWKHQKICQVTPS